MKWDEFKSELNEVFCMAFIMSLFIYSFLKSKYEARIISRQRIEEP